MDESETLRLHVEACWRVRLPRPLLPGEHVCLPHNGMRTPDDEPGWSLYVADLVGGERVRLWRGGVRVARRAALLTRAEAALELPDGGAGVPGVTREVALRLMESPRPGPAHIEHVIRPLGEADRAAIERYEPGESSYYLDAPERVPVIGAFTEDGQLAAIAHSSRRTADTCELGVATAAWARRRGLGLAVTHAWTAAVAATGRLPLYSALAGNGASLALAYAAGYRPFARAAYCA
ncbi:MAG: GNAT family N-acetyltransferase [Ktedonobacterales bacterium]